MPIVVHAPLTRTETGPDLDRSSRRLASRRKARYRAVQAAGGAILQVKVADLNALTDALLTLRWLSEGESEDRRQIAAAVGAMLDDLAESQRRKCPA